MKIAFYEVREDEKEYFKDKLKDFKLLFFSDPIKEDNIAYDADIISIFIDSKINKNLLDKLKNIKFICTRSTGYDHIDLEECKKKRNSCIKCPQLWCRNRCRTYICSYFGCV